MYTNSKTRMITTAGIMIALSQILSYAKLFEMPQGGSVTAASMVPIIMFSLIYGVKAGLLASFVYGVLQFILGGGITIHPLSILIDYFLAFGVLGFAGIFTRGERNIKAAIAGTIFAIFLRFVFVFLAGIVVWGSYAPEGVAPWLHSLTYNASYIIPEIIISVIVVTILYDRIYTVMKVGA